VFGVSLGVVAMLVLVLVAGLRPQASEAQTMEFPGFESVEGLLRVETGGWVAYAEDPYSSGGAVTEGVIIQVTVALFDTSDAARSGYLTFGDSLLDLWANHVYPSIPDGELDTATDDSDEDALVQAGDALVEVDPGDSDVFRVWAFDFEDIGETEYMGGMGFALTIDAVQVVLVSVMSVSESGEISEALDPAKIATSVVFQTSIQMTSAPVPFYPTSDVVVDLYGVTSIASVEPFDPILYVAGAAASAVTAVAATEFAMTVEARVESQATYAAGAASTATAEASQDTMLSAVSDGWRAIVDAGGDLWLVRPDGGDEVQLTTLGYVRSPQWSPDGTTLVFSVTPRFEPDPSIMIYRNGEMTMVPGTYGCQYPRFTPDSNRLLFACNAPNYFVAGDSQGIITSVDISTMELTQEVPFTNDDGIVVGFDVAEDGTMLLLRDYSELVDGSFGRRDVRYLSVLDKDFTFLSTGQRMQETNSKTFDDRFGDLMPMTASFAPDGQILSWVCEEMCISFGDMSSDAVLVLGGTDGTVTSIPSGTSRVPWADAISADLFLVAFSEYDRRQEAREFNRIVLLLDGAGNSVFLSRGGEVAVQPNSAEIVLLLEPYELLKLYD